MCELKFLYRGGGTSAICPLLRPGRAEPSLVVTCNGTPTDEVCEGDKESRGTPEVGMQQDTRPLPELVQQLGVRFVDQAVLSQLLCLNTTCDIMSYCTSLWFFFFFSSHLDSSEQCEALQHLMRSVRWPSPPVTVSCWCNRLSRDQTKTIRWDGLLGLI